MTEAKKSTRKEKPKVEEAIAEAPINVEQVVVESSQEEDSEPKWDLETWREVCLKKLGTPKYVLAGALHGKDQNAMYSEREMRELIEVFLNRPAKN